MSTNGLEVCEELEDLIRCYEEKGQTVVLAAVDGENIHYVMCWTYM